MGQLVLKIDFKYYKRPRFYDHCVLFGETARLPENTTSSYKIRFEGFFPQWSAPILPIICITTQHTQLVSLLIILQLFSNSYLDNSGSDNFHLESIRQYDSGNMGQLPQR